MKLVAIAAKLLVHYGLYELSALVLRQNRGMRIANKQGNFLSMLTPIFLFVIIHLFEF